MAKLTTNNYTTNPGEPLYAPDIIWNWTDFKKHWPSTLGRFEIKDVIFNPPATIVRWADGTKTVVKCMEGQEFDKYVGFAMAVAKRAFGAFYKKNFKKFCGK